MKDPYQYFASVMLDGLPDRRKNGLDGLGTPYHGQLLPADRLRIEGRVITAIAQYQDFKEFCFPPESLIWLRLHRISLELFFGGRRDTVSTSECAERFDALPRCL